MDRWKLQVNSLRAVGMKATIQQFNEAHRTGGWESVVTKTRNNARLRSPKCPEGEGIFDAAVILLIVSSRDDGREYVKCFAE